MKMEIQICDICGRELQKVNTEAFSGRGSLIFRWTLGGFGGGSGSTIEKKDLCCKCTQKMKEAIETAIGSMYEEAVMVEKEGVK